MKIIEYLKEANYITDINVAITKKGEPSRLITLLIDQHNYPMQILNTLQYLSTHQKKLLTADNCTIILDRNNQFILSSLIPFLKCFTKARIHLDEKEIEYFFKFHINNQTTALEELLKETWLTQDNWDAIKTRRNRKQIADVFCLLQKEGILDDNNKKYLLEHSVVAPFYLGQAMIALHKQNQLTQNNLDFLKKCTSDCLQNLNACMALYEGKKINDSIWEILKKGIAPRLLEVLDDVRSPFPKTYPLIYQTKKTSPLQNARALLNDYTKNNSGFLLFLYGHWRRHHVAEVASIVKKIDANEINDMGTLFNALSTIRLVNHQGSLARRMAFILKQESPEEELSNQPGFHNMK